jgi:DnaJ-class molecular chaperone
MIKIDGEGMIIVPSASERVDPLDPPKRGDMYVRFAIKFPKTLTDTQKTRLAAVLAQ